MRVALATQADLPAWEVDDAPLHRALEQAGIDHDLAVWSDPDVDWAAYDAVVVRTTWDYMARFDAFAAWIDRVGAATRLFNPAPVLRWNVVKTYLRDLAAQGVPIAPTAWFGVGDRADVAQLMADRGWARGFIKPVIGQTAYDTLRFDTSAAGLAEAQAHLDRLLPAKAMMVQPYLAKVETRGEISALYIDGVLTHGVQKVPVPGDYRVQDDWGASDQPYAWSPQERAVADAAVAAARKVCALDAPLLYARADFLWDDQDALVLTELELVEPSLFFRHGAHAAPALARAIQRRSR